MCFKSKSVEERKFAVGYNKGRRFLWPSGSSIASAVCDQSSGLMELTCRVEIIFVEVGVWNDWEMNCGRFRTGVDSDGGEFVGNCEATDDCGIVTNGMWKDF